MHKFWTGRGDDGFTELGGKRLKKSDDEIKFVGALDELNSILGVARCLCSGEKSRKIIFDVQKQLFNLEKADVLFVEKAIASIDVASPKHFVVPGGSLSSAVLHYARTVCRRAETLKPNRFLNRVSSLLFVLALYENKLAKIGENEKC